MFILEKKYQSELPVNLAKFSELKGLEIEKETGCLYLDLSEKLRIYCTPFWEGCTGIEIQVTEEGEPKDRYTVAYQVTGDIIADSKNYTEIMTQTLIEFFTSNK